MIASVGATYDRDGSASGGGGELSSLTLATTLGNVIQWSQSGHRGAQHKLIKVKSEQRLLRLVLELGTTHLMKQMSSDTLHTLRVQGEVAPEPVKYVLLVLMVSPHPAEKVQHVPNPLAQLPDDVPPAT